MQGEPNYNCETTIYVPCEAIGAYTEKWLYCNIKGISHSTNLRATKGGKAQIVDSDCETNTITIEAVASDSNYHFVSWSDGSTNNPYTPVSYTHLTLPTN